MRTIHAGHQRAHVLVQGALSSLDGLTRPDGIPSGAHVPRQIALALRSAADLLDPPALRLAALIVRENAFVPEGEVWVRPAPPLTLPDALERYTNAASRIRAGDPYPACCYPEAAVDRLLEHEADEARAERGHAEGV